MCDWGSRLKSKIHFNSQNIKTDGGSFLPITAHIILKLNGSYKVNHPKQKKPLTPSQKFNMNQIKFILQK